jgi:hypothetical protein
LEKFIGRKLDFKVDLRVAFGDYCQVSNADIDNSLSPRTSGAIALLPSHNLRGSVTFYDLTTMRVIKRDTFKILPISQDIVKRINEIAISQKQSKSPHLEVLQGHDQTQVADDDDAIPEVEQSPLLSQRVIHHIIPPNDEIETTLNMIFMMMNQMIVHINHLIRRTSSGLEILKRMMT